MRRYDLDWLRVLVFLLLIFYHVGMFFVPWEWHIKNNRLYEWLEYPMLFVNQWRLPILFVISGMGTSYALAKRTGKQFAAERLKRLLIPLTAGILLIVPPQVYYERLSSGAFFGSYWDFWPSRAFLGVYPEGNFSWHHLWFLPYLLVFSLAFTPLFLYFRKNPGNPFLRWIEQQVKSPVGFSWFLLPLVLPQIFLRPYFPETHALIGDWYTLTNYGLLFMYGFILIMVRESFWKTVQENRRPFLLIGLLAFNSWLFLVFNDNVPIWAEYLKPILKVINCWSWVLVLFGYAAKYLNKKSEAISYANQAVYPFYILHQTITVSLGFYIRDLDWSLGTKALLLVAGTFVISGVLYEFLIRRLQFLRPLFGLKQEANKRIKPQVAETVSLRP
ncbi:MAG: acyltransferase family protein [Salinimicrobium sediminis]|nr:acyltransferase family protein [Salinimicrobium sediminis]